MITLSDHMGREPAPRLGKPDIPLWDREGSGRVAPAAVAKQRQQAERIALWAAQKPRPGFADCTILYDAEDDCA